MNITDFENFLVKEQDDLEWQEHDGKLRIYSNKWKTVIDIDLNKLDNIIEAQIKKEITQGKDIVQITRVTGFYSIVNNWNKGKKGELHDRYRIDGAIKL